jgi:DnaJ family protein C protein 2
MQFVLPTAADWSEDSTLPEGLTLIKNSTVEANGFSYYYSLALQAAINDGTIAGVEAAVEEGPADGDDGPATRHTGKTKTFIKLHEDERGIDWYEILALENEDANDNEIRMAYKRRCLETHPDKQPDHSDALFKKVQRAFEILSCPDGRRAFDSCRPFDDTIPLDGLNLDDDESLFYTTYGPVFERNKKFSNDPKISLLGDETTPIANVRRFYDEWLAFRSWRDFSHDAKDLQEIKEDMPREEKRYYLRENQRVLDKLKKDEVKRVRTLVERAMKLDPRLRKYREEVQAAKDKEKADKEAAIERVRAEAEAKLVAKIAAEREEAEAKKAAEKNAKQRIIDLKERVIVRFEDADLLCEIPTNKLLPDVVRLLNIDWLMTVMKDLDELQAFADRLYTIDDLEVVGYFNDFVEERELIVGQSRYGEPCRRLDNEAILARQAEVAAAREAARIRAAGVVWEEEDVANLQKAIAKYPGGTMDRWRKMAQFLRDKYTEDEVLMKTKKLEAELKSKAGGNTATTSASQRAGNASSVKPSASAPAEATDVEDWTPEQQKHLENGIRELKAYKQKDKWQRISKKVEGKDAKQCFERYRHLCNLNKNQ